MQAGERGEREVAFYADVERARCGGTGAASSLDCGAGGAAGGGVGASGRAGGGSRTYDGPAESSGDDDGSQERQAAARAEGEPASTSGRLSEEEAAGLVALFPWIPRSCELPNECGGRCRSAQLSTGACQVQGWHHWGVQQHA